MAAILFFKGCGDPLSVFTPWQWTCHYKISLEWYLACQNISFNTWDITSSIFQNGRRQPFWAAILDLQVRITMYAYINIGSRSVMIAPPQIKHVLYLTVHLAPYIIFSAFSKWRMAAILDLEVKRIPYSYLKHRNGLVIIELV